MPSDANAPRPNHAAAPTTTAPATAAATMRGSASERRSSARTKINVKPTMIARTAYEPGMLSAGEMSICSSLKNARVAGIRMMTKLAMTIDEIASRTAAVRAETRRGTAVSRMCWLRR